MSNLLFKDGMISVVAGLSDSSICVWDDHRTNRKFLGLSRIYFLC